MSIQKPTAADLAAYTLEKELQLAPFPLDKGFYLGEPGKEHYKLLAWFGHQYDGVTIIEIGTLWGGSAMALGQNKKNKVLTFDVHPHDCARFPFNIQRRIIRVEDTPFDEICKSPLIFYDAAHEGPEEIAFVAELERRQWKGILILDDIRLNAPMFDFWQGITQRKEDWTDIGHFCGTGIVYFE